MKKNHFRKFAFYPLVFVFFLTLGCGTEKASQPEVPQADAEAAVEAAGKVSSSDANPASADALAQTDDAVVESAKPAELDKAVEAHIEEVLKENPDLAKAEAPIQMTYFFIRALQMDNEKAVHGMLSEDAYREISKKEGIPCPEFIKNSDVAMGNVQYLADEEDETKIVGARVGTIWKIQSAEGVHEENIAWVFRFESGTWLAAGMISVVDPKYPPILINFENLAETEEEMKEREKAIARINAEEAKKTEKAENPAEAQTDAEAPKAGTSETETNTESGTETNTETAEPAAPMDGETPLEATDSKNSPQTAPNLPAAADLPAAPELPAELPSELPSEL